MSTEITKLLSEMTPQEARIAIAQDVIKQLKYYKVQSVYCELPREIFDDIVKYNDKDAKEEWEQIKNCEVCGIGACFLSYVHLFNNTTIGDLVGPNFYTISSKLNGIFSMEQLECIENAFEGYRYGSKTIKTLAFYERHSNERSDRKGLLKQIMLNIIENNGTFIP